MKNVRVLLSKGRKLADQATKRAAGTSKVATRYWNENKDELQEKGTLALRAGQKYAHSTVGSATQAASGIYRGLRYSDDELTKLKNNIENQGGYYRELNRKSTTLDSIVLGGETLATLLSSGTISDEVINAYEAAYPDLSNLISFKDKVLELDKESLIGFISGVKGKLFEQKYVDYLNNDNLPDGYAAVLAESATQTGWDIVILGSNGEIASLLQAKATNSVSYVQDALEKYPNIDVVTTDEVYSHLVMSGISENITSSSISNADLVDTLNDSVDATDLTMDYTPPVFALALIAFTSYKDESLTLYEKARSAGDRSGKTYLSYLIGSGIAAITNTWWLGVLGSVSSRMVSDSGNKKYEMYEALKNVESVNQKIIAKLKPSLS